MDKNRQKDHSESAVAILLNAAIYKGMYRHATIHEIHFHASRDTQMQIRVLCEHVLLVQPANYTEVVSTIMVPLTELKNKEEEHMAHTRADDQRWLSAKEITRKRKSTCQRSAVPCFHHCTSYMICTYTRCDSYRKYSRTSNTS